MVGWEGTPWNMKHDLRSQNVDAILAQDPLKKPEIPLKKTRGSKSSVEVSSILARQGPVKFETKLWGDGLW